MRDKQVRRRRLVLAALVGVSLVLLTASFGGTGGPLLTLQRGVSEILSPIQEGASRALKPVRDLASWIGDTFDAKDEVKRLRAERDALRLQVVGSQAALEENTQLRRMVGLDTRRGVDAFNPVTARVIGRSPTVWYARIEVDKGSDDGVRVNQPVIAGDGLVGKVTDVTSGTAIVTLITDHTSGVSAKILRGPGELGTLVPAVGDPNDLLIQYLPGDARVRVGDQVVTAGSRSSRLESLFPPDLPIGTVSKVSADELRLNARVHMRPSADLQHLDFVQILTRGVSGDRAQVP
ncbi:MAG: rod shape-determining protein MreC [Solirubrobacteraceae bacterium]